MQAAQLIDDLVESGEPVLYPSSWCLWPFWACSLFLYPWHTTSSVERSGWDTACIVFEFEGRVERSDHSGACANRLRGHLPGKEKIKRVYRLGNSVWVYRQRSGVPSRAGVYRVYWLCKNKPKGLVDYSHGLVLYGTWIFLWVLIHLIEESLDTLSSDINGYTCLLDVIYVQA